ncbi:hypothetical protein Tsubulata_020176, partial [Turnera subulata]
MWVYRPQWEKPQTLILVLVEQKEPRLLQRRWVLGESNKLLDVRQPIPNLVPVGGARILLAPILPSFLFAGIVPL